LEQCGQKGGGAHEAFIAAKREVAMAEKEKKKAEKAAEAARIEEEKNDLCTQLYPMVEYLMGGKAAEFLQEHLTSPPTAGKIVGMFKAGLSVEELQTLVNNTDERCEALGEAFDVLLAAQEAAIGAVDEAGAADAAGAASSPETIL